MQQRLGKSNVTRDVKLFDPYGNLSQIDLRFGWLRKTYVECKCYRCAILELFVFACVHSLARAL